MKAPMYVDALELFREASTAFDAGLRQSARITQRSTQDQESTR